MKQSLFEQYLLAVRGISRSSVAHYFESMRKITELARKLGLLEAGSIYDIDSLPLLLLIRQKLTTHTEFIDLDKRGHQMYSAGLNNYIRFAEGTDFFNQPADIAKLDIPQESKPMVIKEIKTPSRNRIIVNQEFQAANYHCEINHDHMTFIAQANGLPFVEGHHILPLSLQDQFEYSLDNYANIIALCPTCHRFFHLGTKTEREHTLVQLYNDRKERFQASGILLTEGQFMDLSIKAIN